MTTARRRGPRRSAGAVSAALCFGVSTSLVLSMGPSVATPRAAAAPARAAAAVVVVVDPSAERALHELRDDASGSLEVSRDETGAVEAVVSSSGEAVLESGERSPEAAAEEQLEEYGAAFGIDGSTSEAVVTQTLPSATGGTIVRAQQTIDGVEVFGGQVVTTLDATDDVVSVSADTVRDAESVEVSAPGVSTAAASRIALRATSRARSVPEAYLTTSLQGRRLYDPGLVGIAGQAGARSVWEVEVRDGASVRETVLIGTGRGEVALRFDNAPSVGGRWICDNADAMAQPDDQLPAMCDAPARGEGNGPTSTEEVDDAYDHVGETAAAYGELAGIDLADVVGVPGPDGKRLVATVRWCVTDRSCPYENAFWDGRQVVLGKGLEAADDVVAHELTHGYVERTSNLYYFQQSGAINESFADVVGEIVDRRNGGEDTEWTVGEDIEGPLAGRLLRTLSDPEQQGMPDRMSSPRWSVENWDEGDRGAVHHNLGVGNKTAYLISQGEEFNGQSVVGIDDGDPALAKTGLLYLETIPRLTSGAQYADLGRVLLATCDELAAGSTGGFTEADCDSVRDATRATELDQAPADPGGSLGEAPRSCPVSTSQRLLARDDDGVDDFAWRFTPGLWLRTGRRVSDYDYARSGDSSLFGYDPDPTGVYQDPPISTATSAPLELPLTVGGVFFHFHHAFALDHVKETYFDGATVRLERQVGAGWAPVPMPESAWDNGPDKQIIGRDGFTGFGGDSLGWGSSRLDLTPLAGETVRVVLHIEADQRIAALGWWLDDLRLYACEGTPPRAPSAVTAQARAKAVTLRWQPPTSGTPPTAYDVSRSDGATVRLPASARSSVLRGFAGTVDAQVSVAAVAAGGAVGTSAGRRVEATTATVVAPARVRRGQRFAVTGRAVQRGTTVGVRGVTMTLQRRIGGTANWVRVASGPTALHGARRWTVRQRKLTAYRVVVTASGLAFGSTSAARAVRMR